MGKAREMIKDLEAEERAKMYEKDAEKLKEARIKSER